MHILLFGKNGQVGWELQRALAPLGRITAVDFDSTDYCGDFSKPAGVAETAKRHGKPVIAVAGHIGTGIDELHEVGIDAVFGIAPGAASLSELLADAAANVTRTTEQIVRTLQL